MSEVTMAGRVELILVGGFLGAGKTTLLARAAGMLAARGRRVGLITNDQAADLVDSEMLKAAGFGVREVAGGCFCCRFEDLISASVGLIERIQPDVLIGEPVGSCTDLSATVLQPLKKLHADRFRVAPFSVLVDPRRLIQALRPQLPAALPAALPMSVGYIYRKQLEEADLIVLNKADQLAKAELDQLTDLIRGQFPGRPVLAISALTGQGVDRWLAEVAGQADAGGGAADDGTGRSASPAGRFIADVDYDTYAEGEAALGWFNGLFTLGCESDVDWSAWAGGLIRRIQSRLAAESAEIAHLKLFLRTSAGTVAASLTRTAGAASVRSTVRGRTREATLTVNARVSHDPAKLRLAVEAALAAQDPRGQRVGVTVTRVSSFRPARPQPVHRFRSPV